MRRYRDKSGKEIKFAFNAAFKYRIGDVVSVLVRPRDHTIDRSEWVWTVSLYLNHVIILSTHMEGVRGAEILGEVDGDLLHGFCEAYGYVT